MIRRAAVVVVGAACLVDCGSDAGGGRQSSASGTGDGAGGGTSTSAASRPATTRTSAGTTVRAAATTSTTPAATSGELTYQTLLGKALTDPAIVSYLNTHRCESNGSSSYLCRSAGTFVTFGGSDRRVVRVRLYAGAEGVSAYKGALPRGLTWSDTRASIERKIGSPQALQPGVATSPPVFAVATYSAPTMEVTYQWTDGAPPPDAKMLRLEIAST